MTDTIAGGAGCTRTIDSVNPRTGDVIETFPLTDEAGVSAAVVRARAAAAWWRDQGFDGRRKWLLTFKSAIARDAGSLVDVVSRETGKPAEDALLEIIMAVSHLDWAAKHAKPVLRRRRVASGLVSANQGSSLGYEPLGVIGVIGPWNYPVYTPMGSIAYSLAAGNAVVFKPSELSPGVGVWLARAWDSIGTGHPVLQTITGNGATGAALCTSGVDKLAFTGSTATAKKVMAACAQTLTPLVVEGGGKDAMLVDGDANLESAADFAAFGAMSNAGQTCAGVERIYVVDSVFDSFLSLFTAKVQKLKAGGELGANYGPMTLGKQTDIVRGQVEDALAKGGRAVVGGLGSIRAPYIDPIVLVDVPENSTAITEETFGPTVVVNRIRDLDEGVEKANGTSFGLGASVFTKSGARGKQVAEKLRAGVVTVNSVLGFAGVAALPFGGVGDSGFGRIHGADGLREFSRAKSVTVQRFKAPLNLLTMTRTARDMKVTVLVLDKLHGRS